MAPVSGFRIRWQKETLYSKDMAETSIVMSLAEVDTRPARRHDMDWLKVLVVFLLIPHHTARIFDYWAASFLKDNELSTAMSYLIAFLDTWQMPLMFVLAGATARLALNFRTGPQFVKERFMRLAVPLVFGLVAIVPLQAYYAARSRPGYQDSYLQYYPTFFEVHLEDLSGFSGRFTVAHLWFILYLFVFSVIMLPLFLYLKGEAGQRIISRLAALFQRRWVIFLPAIPLILPLKFPEPDGKNPLLYISLLVYGYILISDARFGEALAKHRRANLAIGAVLISAFLISLVVWEARIIDYRISVALARYLRNLTIWFWIIGVLAYAQRYLSFGNRLLEYAVEAAYPFYIIHQILIIAIGYYVIQWDIGVPAKFLIIASAAFMATMAVYEALIKRVGVARFLFGMRPMRKPGSRTARERVLARTA